MVLETDRPSGEKFRDVADTSFLPHRSHQLMTEILETHSIAKYSRDRGTSRCSLSVSLSSCLVMRSDTGQTTVPEIA